MFLKLYKCYTNFTKCFANYRGVIEIYKCFYKLYNCFYKLYKCYRNLQMFLQTLQVKLFVTWLEVVLDGGVKSVNFAENIFELRDLLGNLNKIVYFYFCWTLLSAISQAICWNFLYFVFVFVSAFILFSTMELWVLKDNRSTKNIFKSVIRYALFCGILVSVGWQALISF